MSIRRILAMLLAGAMLLAALPVAALADEAETEMEMEFEIAADDADFDSEEVAEASEELLFGASEAGEAPAPADEDEVVEAVASANAANAAQPVPNGSGIAIDATHFPDKVFRAWVSDNADTDGDDALSKDEVAAVTYIEGLDGVPTSMKGIEYFTKLKGLDIEGHKLSSLDLSANTKLEQLNCYTLTATELDLSANTALTLVYLPDSSLKSLNVSGLNKLDWLSVEGGEKLATLKLKSNSKLTYLNCQGTKLSELDLSWCMALERLYCGGTDLKTLDVSESTSLETLVCRGSALTQLKLPANAPLTYMDCGYNKLTELNVGRLTSLRELRCEHNKLKELDVGSCKKLQSLYCQGNEISMVSVWNCTKLAAAVNAGKPAIVTDFDDDDNYVGVIDHYSASDGEVELKVDHGVTVYAEKPTVSHVWLDRSAMLLYIDDEARLTATVEPASAINGLVTWSSSNESVADVEDGVVYANAKGKTTITATSVANPSKKATCVVTVQSKTVSKSLKKKGSDGTVKLNKGRQIQLDPVFATKKGWKVKKYSTSNKRIASVNDEGLVVAKKAGKATITVLTKNRKTARIVVKVEDPTVCKKIKLNKKKSVSVNLGSTLTLHATLTPDTAVSKLKWRTSNRRAATVSQNGVVTPVKPGKTVISVTTENGKKAKVTVTVVDPAVPTKVKLNKSGTLKLKKGKTYQLKATVKPGTAVTTLKWKSSKKKVATVTQDGLVTAKKKGTTTITVKTKNGKTAKVKIRVK